jgi:hypothetical protein
MTTRKTAKIVSIFLLVLLLLFCLLATILLNPAAAGVAEDIPPPAEPTQGYGVLKLTVNAPDGTFIVPTNGNVNSGNPGTRQYDWLISKDSGASWVRSTGTGSAAGVSLTGITGDILIKEYDGGHTNGWLAAFSFGYGGAAGVSTNLAK